MNNTYIYNEFQKFSVQHSDYQGAMFIGIFDKLPKSYRIHFNAEDKLVYTSRNNKFDYHTDTKSKVNERVLLNKAIEFEKINTDIIKVFCFSCCEWLILYEDDKCSFLINIVTSEDDVVADFWIDVYTNNIEEAFKIISNWCEPIEHKSNIEFGITAVDNSGSLYTTWYDYSDHEIDIEKNYNDDLPYDKMCELIESEDKPELMLFYGDPGTGKTSLIKHFISKFIEKQFVFMDGTLLANVQQERLMSYFLEHQNTIFILEDCEKVLMNREHNNNPVMPVLLNLTDGIIGDVLGIKLICTFNTSLNNIDKALIRKGRLSLKYEFKKLSKDKVVKILGEGNNEDMSLADIYYKEENDFSKKNTKKIGF